MALDKLTLKSKGEEFKVMLNPQDFSIKDSIDYSSYNEPRSKKFKNYGASEIAIPKIFLDTTGAIPEEEWPMKGSIQQMVDKLRKMVFDFDGDSHEPPIVEITWGSSHFKGRLTSMDTKYVLFDPEGSPIRAEVDLKFALYDTLKSLEAKANKHSPDLTHIIEVKAGDTLPNLCYRVYKEPSYYMQVARINQLSSFCYLVPGTKLVFPPLVD